MKQFCSPQSGTSRHLKNTSKYSDVTLSLSIDKLADHKKKVREASTFVEEALTAKNIWWQEKPDLNVYIFSMIFSILSQCIDWSEAMEETIKLNKDLRNKATYLDFEIDKDGIVSPKK